MADNFADYESALNTIEALNPAPQILAKAARKLDDEDADIDDIVELLHTDAGLTAEIIRISNSAYYGFETRSNSLSDSISRIGFDQITRLIGMCLSKDLFARTLSHYGITAQAYWAQSMSAAIIVEQLARMHGENPEDGFTVGLLHAVGRIIINQIMDEHKIDAGWDGGTPIEEWERETIGFTYSYAGAMILKRWEFSSKITHPIFYQLHEPNPEHGWSLHAYLHFAICLIDYTLPGFEKENFEIMDPLAEIMKAVSVEEEDLVRLVRICRDQYILTKHTIGV